MKLSFLFATLPMVLFSCKQVNKVTANSTNADSAILSTSVEKEHAENLHLDKGHKWHTDTNTKGHVLKLSSRIAIFNKAKTPDLDSYKVLADDLLKELNALIADCKMSGPEHEALHIWLEPALENAGKLKKISTMAEGRNYTAELTNRLQEFDKYFI